MSSVTVKFRGIPAVEDKIVQLALKKILEAIFEEDFCDVSFGFRPNRSCHDAMDMVDKTIMTKPVNYVVDMDIASKKLRQKMKEMNQWLKGIRNRMKREVRWRVLRQKLLGHYQYYGMSGNTREIKNYYYLTVRLAFKWINRRSQKKSYNWTQFNRFLVFNPLPKPKIYPLTYTLFKRRGCVPEEPDEGKPQVRFCEGAHSNLGANTPSGGRL